MSKKIKHTDGLGPHEIAKIRSAIRLVWQRCHARKEAVKRVTIKDGDKIFYKCELCADTVPQIKIDHITPVGTLRDGFIERLFCPSTDLQAICNTCHKKKTKEERAAIRKVKK